MLLTTIHEYEILVHERHLDTFGHMNNATYLQILEEARWDLITQNGYGLDTVQKTQIGPTILEITLRFRREIKNREKIKIVTRCTEHAGKIGTIEQRIFNEKNEECTLANFRIGLFDLKKRALIEPTPEWKKAIGLPE